MYSRSSPMCGPDRPAAQPHQRRPLSPALYHPSGVRTRKLDVCIGFRSPLPKLPVTRRRLARSICPWRHPIATLVPDGNATVTLVLAGGRRKTAPVIDNVFEVTVAARVAAIIDRDIHGRIVRKTLGG